jgi:PPOX class probable F420-dependent enzyme
MGVELIEDVAAKLREPNYWHVATLNPDGSPQVTPVWADLRDGRILVNTVVGRKKDRNLRSDDRVALSLHIPEGYANIAIQGRVVERIEGDQAERHIDELARKYTGNDYAGRTPDMRRVTFLIEPVHVWYRPPM